MAVSAAPKRKEEPKKAAIPDAKQEKKIREVVNRGGSSVAESVSTDEAKGLKGMSIKLTDGETETIGKLRAARPRDPRSQKKIAISLRSWIIEAVHEKMEREKKKYGI